MNLQKRENEETEEERLEPGSTQDWKAQKSWPTEPTKAPRKKNRLDEELQTNSRRKLAWLTRRTDPDKGQLDFLKLREELNSAETTNGRKGAAENAANNNIVEATCK